MLRGLLSVVVALPLLVGFAQPAAAQAPPGIAPKPTGVTTTAGDGAVLLRWNKTNRSETVYWGYRQKAGSSGSYDDQVEIPGGGSDTTSYLVTGLTNGVTYTFEVILTLGNEHGLGGGSRSDEVTATPMAVAGAPKLVSVKRYAQATGQLGVVNHFTLFPALIWRLEFDRWVSYVRPSDFTLTGTTAKIDLWNDWDPNYQPSFTDQKTAIYVVAHGGDLATVSGDVTLNIASHHNIHNIGDNVNDMRNIRDDEKLYLSRNPVPTSGTNQNSFTLNPNETLVYFTQENLGVAEGDEAEVTVRLSRLRDTATTIAFSATPLTATGNGVDYHGLTYQVTIPAYRASATVKIRTTADTLTEDDETFRLDIYEDGLPDGVTLTTIPGSAEKRTYVTIRDGDNSGGQGTSQDAEPSSLSQPADEQASPQQAEESCVSDSLLVDVQGYAGETWRKSVDHVERWERVLAAFGQANDYSANPMTATEAQTYADRGWPRWIPVTAALECVETTPDEQPEEQPEAQPAQEPTPPPVTPQVSVAAGVDIVEGADATFTVTADPAPHAGLSVDVAITQTGDHGAATGTRTVTIPTSGTYTLTVATTDDSTDETDGSVTATVNTASGYDVSATAGAATIAVSDDDDTPPDDPPAEDTSDSGTVPAGPPTVTVSDATADEGSQELRFAVTLSHPNPRDITFRYGGYGRTATLWQDWSIEFRRTFTLAAGDTAIDITVPVIDDNTPENTETLRVYIYATSGIVISDGFLFATGTITDND